MVHTFQVNVSIHLPQKVAYLLWKTECSPKKLHICQDYNSDTINEQWLKLKHMNFQFSNLRTQLFTVDFFLTPEFKYKPERNYILD